VHTADFRELPFVACIPQGHDALVVAFLRSPDATKQTLLALDLTTSILYCDEEVAGMFRSPQQVTDPVGALTRWSWVVASQQKGRVAAAIVSTANSGDANYAKTCLFFDPPKPAAPYR
jgi:hypothetical protein